MGNARTAKHKAMLPNGRSSKVSSPDSWFIKVFPMKDLIHPAWRTLSSSAKDLLMICRAKSGRAAASKGKKDGGGPIFEFTVKEAKAVFRFTDPTFTTGIETLLRRGFIDLVTPGGAGGCGKGIAAIYRLSDRWKTWEPPARDNTNIEKARASRKKNV